jgi:hypothetical protein
MPFAQSLSFQIQSTENPILESEEIGGFGYFLLALQCTGSRLSEKNLFALVSRTNEWVRFRLGMTNLYDSIGHLYSILILTEGTPQLKGELDTNVTLLTQLVPGIVRPGVTPDSNYVKSVVSSDFGTTMTDTYRFSLRGALIYERNYNSSERYIEKLLIPTVARLKSAQAFFEMLNQQLNERLGQNPEHMPKLSPKSLGNLKEAILRSLAAAEHSYGLHQILEISKKLRIFFGLDLLQSSLNSKVDVLDSVLQQISDAKAQRTNTLLTIAGLLLAVIALPPILEWLIKLFSGK